MYPGAKLRNGYAGVRLRLRPVTVDARTRTRTRTRIVVVVVFLTTTHSTEGVRGETKTSGETHDGD
jgi:hypothetical protein